MDTEFVVLPRATLPKLSVAQDIIDSVKNATLKDDIKSIRVRGAIENPSVDSHHLNPNTHLSLRMFITLLGSSRQTYTKIRDLLATLSPPINLLSYHEAKTEFKAFTNVTHVKTDMCPKGCLAFTGPFKDDTTCSRCGASRYKSGPGEVPRKQFSTIPLAPQIQALWRHPSSAKDMRYLLDQTENLDTSILEDFCHSSDFLSLFDQGKIQENDVFLIFSLDGAQLYRDKASDCWFFIWIILNLSPNLRYKKRYVIPGGFVPGPEKPVILESFLLPGFRHLSALQKTGLPIFDGSINKEAISRLWFIGGTSDTVAAPALNGLVGHTGSLGCRLYCGFRGRHKPSVGVYYPASLQPRDSNGHPSGHPDVPIDALGSPNHATYMNQLAILLGSPTRAAFTRRRRLTGIVRPSICLGFDPSLSFSPPTCFTLDLMHLAGLNLPRHLIDIWLGDKIPLDGPGGKPPFVVLDNEHTWHQHGKLVADARPYLPSSFDRPPRNPVEKLNSGYKAVEYITYVWILGPALFRLVLPPVYWLNFCKLVYAIRVLHQRRIRRNDLFHVHDVLIEWGKEFESLYYQRRMDLLQLVRPCVHTILHAVDETFRRGPLGLYAQWTLENMIGNLGREVRQPSNPFANLAERGLLRAQISAAIAIDPTLSPPPPSLPRGSVSLGGEYLLLTPREDTYHRLTPPEIEALTNFYTDLGYPMPSTFLIQRWARLQLPNGQITRSLWKEKSTARATVRISRNVKYLIDGPRFGEVQYFSRLDLGGVMTAIAVISQYTDPEPGLLRDSFQTLRVCHYLGNRNIVIVKAKLIEAVVAMVPFPLTPAEKHDAEAYKRLAGSFFVGEKLVFEMVAAERDEDSDQEDNS
ncbi:hypothetical protein BDN72DRAFT_773869 [Pluteus cervinus]|uniref:Uncharacterized protein n=1 Tax=Pluteus cervinus TaxID=181527 RepID=A0ACD3AHF5_9AGAR|nr:hypothetical protein BDN72DRAFT_773869 [Pluteus cervinus]